MENGGAKTLAVGVACMILGGMFGWSLRGASAAPQPTLRPPSSSATPAPSTPVVLPAPAPQKTVEIVSVDAKVTESNSTWSRFSWQLTLKNNGSTTAYVDATVEFADEQGFVVDDDSEYGLAVPAGETKTFTGYDLVTANVAPTVKKIGAKIRRS